MSRPAASKPSVESGSSTMQAPVWRPRLHPGSSALGIPDFYPPQADAEEYSESVVRHGVSSRPAVGNETMTAHDMIYDRLTAPGVLPLLGRLFDEVLVRRDELQRDKVAASTHRAPPRVTLTEVKLAAYVRDLADASVPLQRLARSVPHGYKGERMLDMLWSGGGATPAPNTNAAMSAAAAAARGNSPRHPVDIARAVWFIRVVGASDITSSRARQNSDYTGEWTSVFTLWLRKQLSELNIAPSGSSAPSSPAMGARSQSNYAAAATRTSAAAAQAAGMVRDSVVLQSAELAKRWSAKWVYSLSLMRALTAASLLDVKVIARWTFETLATSSMAQLVFVLALAQEHVALATSSYALMHPLADSACLRLTELDKMSPLPAIAQLNEQLKALLRHAFALAPDMFVSPALWISHASMLKSVLGQSDEAESSMHAAQRQVDLDALEVRNRAALLADQAVSASRGSRLVEAIELLDSFSAASDLAALCTSYFYAEETDNSASDRLETLLLWATSAWRSGIHRPWLAAQLIQMFCDREEEGDDSLAERPLKRTRREAESFDVDLFLFNWLASVDAALSQRRKIGDTGEQEDKNALASVDVHDVVITFGELVRRQCFNYAKYVQRLTARGLTASTSTSNPTNGGGAAKQQQEDTLHARLLRSLPLYACTAPLLNQRRTAIYGMRQKESHEEASERRAVRELRAAWPWLFEPVEGDQRVEPLESQHVPHLWSASRYTRLKVMTEHLLLAAHQMEKHMDAQQFAVLARVLTEVQDFVSLSKLLILQLRSLFSHEDFSLTSVLFAVVIQHSAIWASMQLLPSLVDLLRGLHSSAIESFRDDLRHATHQALRSLAMLGVQPDARFLVESEEYLPSQDETAGIADDVQRAVADLIHPPSKESDADAITSSLVSRCSSASALKVAALRCVLDALSSEEEQDTAAEAAHRLVILIEATRTTSDYVCRETLRTWTAQQLTSTEAPAGLRRTLALFLVLLTARGSLSVHSLMDAFVLPCVAVAAQAGNNLTAAPADTPNASTSSDPPALLETCLLVLRALFSALIGELILPLRQQEKLLLGACLVELLESRSLTSAFQLVAYLAMMPSSSTGTSSSGIQLCNELLALPQFLAAISSHQDLLYSTVKEVGKASWGANLPSALERIFSALDADGLVRVMPVELDCEHVIKRLDPWRAHQAVVELTIVVERLHCVEASMQTRAQAKLASLAACLFEPLWLGEHSQLGPELLRELKNQDFTGRIVDVGLRRLLEGLTKPRSTSTAPLELVLVALASILHGDARCVLFCRGSEMPNAVFATLTDWFHALSLRSSTLSDESCAILGVRLQCLQLLLRTQGLWTPACKTAAPRLIVALFKLCARFGCEEEDEQLFAALLDAASCQLAELPSDAATPARSALASVLGLDRLFVSSTTGLPMSSTNKARLLRLFAPGGGASSAAAQAANSTASTTAGFVLARNMRAALEHGHYAPAPLRPWDLHDHVEPGGIATAALGSATPGTSTATASPKTELGYAAAPLNNMGSLSLTLFGAHKTRDRIPTPLHTSSQPPASDGVAAEVVGASASVDELAWSAYESERTYGEGRGGEPLFARDARRGVNVVTQGWNTRFAEAAESAALADLSSASSNLPHLTSGANENRRSDALVPKELRAADEALARRARIQQVAAKQKAKDHAEAATAFAAASALLAAKKGRKRKEPEPYVEIGGSPVSPAKASRGKGAAKKR